MLKVWDNLYDLSPVLFCPAMTGPFCQRDKCLEGKMSCGVSISRTMTPARILLTDYPGLSGGYQGMKIKMIDFGVTKERCPFRPHENDAGADVYTPFDCTLNPGDIIKIPLGFGIEIHAIISNVSSVRQTIKKDTRIGQLVITPVVIADFVLDFGEERGTGAFGSTGE